MAREGLRDPGQGPTWYKPGQEVGRAGVREDFLEKGATKSSKDWTGKGSGWAGHRGASESLGSV